LPLESAGFAPVVNERRSGESSLADGTSMARFGGWTRGRESLRSTTVDRQPTTLEATTAAATAAATAVATAAGQDGRAAEAPGH